MKNKYYIYLISTGLLLILSIIYLYYTNNINNNLSNDNISLKNEKQYFLDKLPKNINNAATITNSNKF